MDLTKLSKTELLEKCAELGIIKWKSKNIGELIDLINLKTQAKKQVKIKTLVPMAQFHLLLVQV